MKPRERVLTALERGTPDKVPRALSFYDVRIEDVVPRHYRGRVDVDVRFVEFRPSKQARDFQRYIHQFPIDTHIGRPSLLRTYHEWGYVPGQRIVNPLAAAHTVADVRDFPFPDVTAPYRHRGMEREVAAWQRRGYAVGGNLPHLGGELFESAWRLRGFQNLLMDFVVNKELAHYLLDRLAEQAGHNAAVLARAGVDILALDDDVGMPTTMIISPATWREFLRPRLASIIEAARATRPDLRVLYHSDGYIEPIVPDLIEIGVDALNPLQPEHTDAARIKRLHGDRLALWGTVGHHNTFHQATPADVRAEVRQRIETLGRSGLVLCPAYDVDQPGIPWPNVVAFLEAVDDYG